MVFAIIILAGFIALIILWSKAWYQFHSLSYSSIFKYQFICFPIFMSIPSRHCEPFDARKRTYFPLLCSLVWPITSLVRSGRVGQESGPITRPQSRHSRPSRPHTVGVPAVALGWQEGQRQVLDTRIQKYRNVL